MEFRISSDVDPCNPSPCGSNSICRVTDGHAVCSCQPGLIGSPPSCRPECIVSAECALPLACLNSKCQDPCPGTCGLNAKCNVVNHNPICSCPPGYNGDPFRHCQLVPGTYYTFETAPNSLRVYFLTNRSHACFQLLRRNHRDLRIHVCHHLAVRMQFVKCTVTRRPALVCRITSEHRRIVDRNVP